MLNQELAFDMKYILQQTKTDWTFLLIFKANVGEQTNTGLMLLPDNR